MVTHTIICSTLFVAGHMCGGGVLLSADLVLSLVFSGVVPASPSSHMWVVTEGIEVTGFVWGGDS